jgi:poly(3-hydroxybutyrate) depolymerase
MGKHALVALRFGPAAREAPRASGDVTMRTVLAFSVWPFMAAYGAFGGTTTTNYFTLTTQDAYGNAMQETRLYYVYRPSNLPLTNPAPMVLALEASPNAGPASYWNSTADQAGLLIVSCGFEGNSTSPTGGWNNHNPRTHGWEDYDYLTAVINRVKASDHGNDAFICGFSKGGHTSLAYACERPETIRGAGTMDESMIQTENFPTAPVPVLAIHGTGDHLVHYTMVRDTVDAWRAYDGLLHETPVTTYEASLTLPGRVTQATWRGTNGMQVAFVTVMGGTHNVPVPGSETGYDSTKGMWAFFSQFVTTPQTSPKILAQPVGNKQVAGQPASFWAVAAGNAPLSYQWQKNGMNIPGASSRWHTTPPTALADNGATFRVVVSNYLGSVTSSAATLTVITGPVDPAIVAPPANQTVTGGQPVAFSVSANGTLPLKYQWTKNGLDLPGATNSSLALSAAVAPADCGAPFRVVVSNSVGCVTSIVATLTVLPAGQAPIILANPERPRVLTNQSAIWSVAAWSLTPMRYQWQTGNYTTNLADIPNATNATYTTPPTTTNDNLTVFRCLVSNPTGNVCSASDMLFVSTTVNPPFDMRSPVTAFGQTGVPFSYTIISYGGTPPITYGASPLPPGLSVNPATGVISGVPNTVLTTNIILSASNSAGGLTQKLVLTLTAAPPPIPLRDWRWSRFGASVFNPEVFGDEADPDGDGIRNLCEYALGTDPLSSNWWPCACSVLNGHLTVTAQRDPHATGVIWGAESGGDLSHWRSGDITVLQDTSSTFQVQDSLSTATNAQRFLRLKLSTP